MPRYKLSPAAQNDLVNIFARGYREWGERKANQFQDKLISSFKVLYQNPKLGRSIKIRPGLQRYDENPYVIFYRQFSYGIRVARVLYKNCLMEKHLTKSQPVIN